LVIALLEKEQKGLVCVERTVFLILYWFVHMVSEHTLILEFETQRICSGIKIEGILLFRFMICN